MATMTTEELTSILDTANSNDIDFLFEVIEELNKRGVL